MKQCSSCKELKPEDLFTKQKGTSDGLRSQCKECIKRHRKEPDIKQQIERNKKYQKKRRDSDINYRLACNLRTRLANAIARSQKTGSAISDLGCSLSDFQQYIQRLWKPGMSWDNWNRVGWHIDHIKPLNCFDLTDRSQLLEAVHYTNLQPLWAMDNIKKGARM